jgi:SAM-dependent methyltransferase
MPVNPYETIGSLQLFGTRKYVESGLSDEEEPLYEGCDLNPGRALVLGCSAGRECVVLAERGWRVLGIDDVADLITIGRAYSEQKGLAIEYRVADATAPEALLDGEGPFGFVAFSIYSLIRTSARRLAVLRTLDRHTLDSARIVVIYQGRGCGVRLKSRFLQHALRLARPSYERGDYYYKDTFLHVFSEEELAAEVAQAGFVVTSTSCGPVYKWALLTKA